MGFFGFFEGWFEANRLDVSGLSDLSLLVWLTQLGMSVALPMAGFTLLGVWLRSKFDLGAWVVVCGCAIGLICAIDGLRSSLKIMEQLEKQNEKRRKMRQKGKGPYVSIQDRNKGGK